MEREGLKSEIRVEQSAVEVKGNKKGMSKRKIIYKFFISISVARNKLLDQQEKICLK